MFLYASFLVCMLAVQKSVNTFWGTAIPLRAPYATFAYREHFCVGGRAQNPRKTEVAEVATGMAVKDQIELRQPNILVVFASPASSF